jgi:hypothetical protein
MYEVDELDRVVAVRGLPQSETGAPLPIVVSDEHSLLISYLTSMPDPNWDGSYVESISPRTNQVPVVIVRFKLPYAHIFGPPNDEAFSGHPLAIRGLTPYGFFEVIDSSWIRVLERRNSVHPRHERKWFLSRKRHFVFTFHDSVFECVAEDFSAERMTGSLALALDRMCEILYDSWK